jgi:putative phosphoesterase
MLFESAAGRQIKFHSRLREPAGAAKLDAAEEEMMKIGVISDTHLKAGSEIDDLHRRLAPHFQGLDAILHAGDILDLEVLGMLENFAPVYAVRGNMDPAPTCAALSERRVVELGGFRLGLIHGWGAPGGLSGRVQARFAGERLDVLVFGHSHCPFAAVEDGVLLFNPGSAVDRRFAPVRSVGLLYLERPLRYEIIELE